MKSNEIVITKPEEVNKLFKNNLIEVIKLIENEIKESSLTNFDGSNLFLRPIQLSEEVIMTNTIINEIEKLYLEHWDLVDIRYFNEDNDSILCISLSVYEKLAK